MKILATRPQTMFFFSLIFFAFLQESICQQLPLFTQYRETHGLINPASVNTDYLLYQIRAFGGLSIRQQWRDKDFPQNSPKTQVLHGSYLWEQRGSSLLFGAHLMNDKVGRVGTTGLTARAAVVLSPDPAESGFAAGLSLGAVNYRINLTNARVHDAGDIKASQNQSVFFPDAGLGVFGYTKFSEDNFVYGGLSVPQLLGLDVNFRNEDREFSLRQKRHFYANAGCVLFLRNESFLEISTWAKYVPAAPLNVDVNFRYRLGPVFALGAGWNTSKMLHLDLGVVLGAEDSDNIFKFGFGNTSNIGTLSSYFGNTQEVNLGVGLGNF